MKNGGIVRSEEPIALVGGGQIGPDDLNLALIRTETVVAADGGAAVLLERRTVFISLSAIDVTSAAIQRIDAQIGDGTGASQSGSE